MTRPFTDEQLRDYLKERQGKDVRIRRYESASDEVPEAEARTYRIEGVEDDPPLVLVRHGRSHFPMNLDMIYEVEDVDEAQ